MADDYLFIKEVSRLDLVMRFCMWILKFDGIELID
jgi:hypothetical protein